MADAAKGSSEKQGRGHIWLAALAGASVALGHAPFSLFWLAFPALVFAVHLFLTTRTVRQALGMGWAFGAGYGAVALHWIVEPFFVDVGRHGWMAPFALILMSLGVGAFYGAAFAVARWVSVPGKGVLALALALTGFEVLRSYLFTGFPWGLIAYIWIETPVYQLASYVGPHGLTLLTIGLAGLLYLGLKNRSAVPIVLFIVLASGSWGIGTVQRSVPAAWNGQASPVVRLLQPNANQRDKWNPELMPIFFERQLEMSAAKPTPDMVIWPESSVPFWLNDPEAPLKRLADAAGGAQVIFGAQRYEERRVFNSLVVMNGDQIGAVYDKHHLVPFGEYLPLNNLFSRFGMKALADTYGLGFSAGQAGQVIQTAELGSFIPLICYEGIFPHEIRSAESRPDWMLLLTNDAWFGQFSGPYQHLAQARARAIEFGLPMVRVANTGVTAMIDARGRITGSIGLGEQGYLDADLPKALPATLYWKVGDLPVILLLVTGLVTLRVRKYRLTKG